MTKSNCCGEEAKAVNGIITWFWECIRCQKPCSVTFSKLDNSLPGIVNTPESREKSKSVLRR